MDGRVVPIAPPSQVLEAFGVAGHIPVALEGGEGTSWRAGDLVLKPADREVEEMAWQASIYRRIVADGFRIAMLRPAGDGQLCVDGWCATEFVSGTQDPGRWLEIISVGARFHRALVGIPKPRFLDKRSRAWAIADRVAWAEIPCAEFSEVRHLPLLADSIRPVEAPDQLIHGDLCGNVLFDDKLPPAIIDFSPYWRPASYASAIVIADALLWENADSQILNDVDHIDNFGQYLLRAIIFRLVSEWLLSREMPRRTAVHDAPWRPVVDLARELAAKG
jgi:uncharacterized protein (TIGR02569 family)